jgi:hypothetical protein
MSLQEAHRLTNLWLVGNDRGTDLQFAELLGA